MSIVQPTAEMVNMLKACASADVNEAHNAQRMIAKALELPLKQGVMDGNIFSDIFSVQDYPPGVQIEYPLDLLVPGTEHEYTAYTVPATGAIPEKHVRGDYIAVPTYFIGASIDCAAKYMRDSNWNILNRMMEVLEAMFVRKMNVDAWHVLLTAGYGRNILISDTVATAGFFSRRLVSLMKLSMRRHAGGNSNSMNRRKLTDLYVSPEAGDDPRTWVLSDVGDTTLREIYVTDGDAAVTRYDGVNIHIIDEFGVGQEFDAYLVNTLGAALTNSKLEFCLGLDNSQNNAFVNPVRQPIAVHEDPMLFRQRRVGFWGDAEIGFSCLDTRAVILGEL